MSSTGPPKRLSDGRQPCICRAFYKCGLGACNPISVPCFVAFLWDRSRVLLFLFGAGGGGGGLQVMKKIGEEVANPTLEVLVVPGAGSLVQGMQEQTRWRLSNAPWMGTRQTQVSSRKLKPSWRGRR